MISYHQERQMKYIRDVLVALAWGIAVGMWIMVLSACGYEEWRETDCFNGCVPPETYGNESGTDTTIQSVGQPGPAGRDGSEGPRGISGSTGPSGPTGPGGPPGTAGVDGLPGADGNQGPTGPSGPAGPVGPIGPTGNSGSSCTVTSAIGGALISCTDGTAIVLLNGTNGEDGEEGEQGPQGDPGEDAPPTPYTVTEMIDPCGDQTAYDEILLRLANDQLVAHFSSGSLEFLTVLPPGNYVTTDGTHCVFTVEADLSITGEHN